MNYEDFNWEFTSSKNIFLLHGVTTGRTLVLCGGEGRRVFTNGFENNYCIVKIAL